MAQRGKGKLRLTYRPLEAVDGLQFTLLAATARGACEAGLLEKIVSLSCAAITREMEQLGAVGLVRQESRTSWACTPRGKRVASIGEAFNGQPNITVEVSSADWELGPGDYAVPFEAETAQDVGYLPEEDIRLDQKSALEIVSGNVDNGSTRRDSERAKRRHSAAVGVLVYSWLTRRPDPVGAVARIEPCDFACHVYDWQITHPQGPYAR
jgi:hypothetical protein